MRQVRRVADRAVDPPRLLDGLGRPTRCAAGRSTIGTDADGQHRDARGETVTAPAEQIVERLGNPDWGGSYFTMSEENNYTIWAFLKKCHDAARSTAATT